MNIFDAIGEDNVLKYMLLVEDPKNVHLVETDSGDQRTVLMEACLNQRELLVERLLELGADPNARDAAGWTALHYTTYFGCDRCTEVLLKHGADPSIETHLGRIPISFAVQRNHLFIQQLLTKASIKRASQ